MHTDLEVLRAAIGAILPHAFFDVQNGEIIIATGLTMTAEGKLVPVTHTDPED